LKKKKKTEKNENKFNHEKKINGEKTLPKEKNLDSISNGSTAKYYEFPKGYKELQDLIALKNMNAQMGEIFRECYRYGEASHCDEVRGIKKIIFYANAELKRLEKLNDNK